MELTVEQKTQVAQWVTDGSSLADVQKQLESEFGIKLTYMDVRFLVLDLDVEPQDKQAAVPPPPAPEPDPVPAPSDVPLGAETTTSTPAAPGAPDVPSGVSVELDRIMKPGSVVSGTVVFTDGVSASWSVDQLGRLALDAGDAEYRPSDADLQAFQLELQNALATRGY